eukprot:CFRG4519T1
MLISMNFFTEEQLSLGRLRSSLIRMEETIIFSLIERAQFQQNAAVYQPGALEVPGEKGSFLQFFLRETESLHSKVRRYTSPDETPFSKDLPQPIMKILEFPDTVKCNIDVNLNDKIFDTYVNEVIPALVAPGDDENYGSTAVCDTQCLQALSKRIHFGKFVAETKFCDPNLHDKYVELIKAKDEEGIMALLTNAEVEKRLLARVRDKAFSYGHDVAEQTGNKDATISKLPDLVANIYEKFIIPATKEVEVLYLLRRLDENISSGSSTFLSHLSTDASKTL